MGISEIRFYLSNEWSFQHLALGLLAVHSPGAKHVVPLVASSTVGGRYLLALGIQTDLVRRSDALLHLYFLM